MSCNLRFAGQYEDEESGLHYNRFRYYDSETGQYLTPDPIGLLGGVNPYGYVSNPLRGWLGRTAVRELMGRFLLQGICKSKLREGRLPEMSFE
ncbi:RHS repeat-associated core domain-containing protein [Buttiauxella sp. A2-C2_NF]|nr:RHS repeat-associated core domain-containing protein [Buttiauxella ferragutiae]